MKIILLTLMHNLFFPETVQIHPKWSDTDECIVKKAIASMLRHAPGRLKKKKKRAERKKTKNSI